MFPSLVSLDPACSSHCLSSHLTKTLSHPTCLILRFFFPVSPPIISGVMLAVAVSSGDQRLIRPRQKVAKLRSAVDGWLKETEVKVRDGAAGPSNTDLSRTSDCLVCIIFVWLNIKLFTTHRCQIQRHKGTKVKAVNPGSSVPTT